MEPNNPLKELDRISYEISQVDNMLFALAWKEDKGAASRGQSGEEEVVRMGMAQLHVLIQDRLEALSGKMTMALTALEKGGAQ